MGFRISDLNQRQEKALERLCQAPVPRPPLLKGVALTNPPFRYRLIPFAVPVGLLLLSAGVLLTPFLTLPERWGGALSLKSGQALQLSEERTLAVELPQIQGRILFQGPGRMEVKRVGRRLISGLREGKFALAEGQLYFEAEPSSPKQVLIHTPLLTIRVTGTQFLLGHQAQQGSRLVVVQGVVEVMPGTHGEWEPIPAGMILSVTPQGLIEREMLRKELSLDDFRLPAVNRRFGFSPEPEEVPQVDLRRLLWREE